MLNRFGIGRRRSARGRRSAGGARSASPAWLREFGRRTWLFLAAGIGIGVVIGIALAIRQIGAARLVEGPRTAEGRRLVATAPVQRPLAPPRSAVPIVHAAPLPPATPPAASRPAWEQYALAVPATEGRPMIAIVIDDMGLDRVESARVIGLPGPLTIAFMSYAKDLDRQAQAARAAGDEIWLHLPMEPMDGAVDAGPNALQTGLPPAEIRRRLAWALSRVSGYVGVNNHMGSRFTSSAPGMTIVLQELKARGLAFLDSRTTAQTVASRLAGELSVPHLDRDVFIDNDETVGSVLRQLMEAERIAAKRGYALAIGHPHPTTIAALMQWLPTLRAKGFVLVPASALLRLRQQSTG
jgi:uncharacterized protein